MIEAALLSDIGRRRSQNQDSGGSFPELGLFVVADGMGGHQGGEVASRMAVETIHATLAAAIAARGPLVAGETTDAALSEAAQIANRKIMERSRGEPALEGMGTTATTLLFAPDGRGAWHACVGHVGDSRCYLVRPDGLWQITRDHSLVQEKLRAGMITRAQLKTDRMKNVITRSVGFDLQFGVDLYAYAPRPGDLFLLCSDGLTGPLDDPLLREIFERTYFAPLRERTDDVAAHGHGPLLTRLVETLIAAANEHGGDDNITALVARFSETGPAR